MPLRTLLPTRALALCATALLAGGLHATEPPALGSDLAGLIEHARAAHPELAMRALEAEAARERVEAAGALPDPNLQIELMDFTNTMDGRAASLLPGEVGTTRYRLIQPLPFWGKRELRTAAAALQAEQGGAARALAGAEIEMRVKTAHARHRQLLAQGRIQREQLALVEALEGLASARYAVGLVPQQDALRAQGEITAMKLDLIDNARQLRELRAQLNALLARPADAPLAEPADEAALPSLPARAALAERLAAASPELAGLRLGVQSAETGQAMTLRERYPDFAVGLSNNRPRSGADSWELMVEVNLPLQQSRRRAEERAAAHETGAARARLAAAELRVNGRAGELLAAIEGARERAELLRHSLLPQAQAALRAAEAGYGSGRVNFDTLIEAGRQILRSRLALLDSEAEAQMRLAELEQLLGGVL